MGWGAEGGISSRLLLGTEPDTGLNLTTPRSQPEPKPKSQMLNQLSIFPFPFFFFLNQIATYICFLFHKFLRQLFIFFLLIRILYPKSGLGHYNNTSS